ncbi:MAG: hypothetical protein IKO78_02540 [Bacilli bacterium]|nr:hypothetical protein [Bacilli bacterium]
MSEELMITKEDLVNWLNRPPSNDDLDLIGFITTRLENFYKLEQENKQLREALETKFYCQYANKCNKLYDCTREEYETMTQSNMKLSLEIAELKEEIERQSKAQCILDDEITELQIKIDKAIEYCKNNLEFTPRLEDILEILGDKE